MNLRQSIEIVEGLGSERHVKVAYRQIYRRFSSLRGVLSFSSHLVFRCAFAVIIVVVEAKVRSEMKTGLK